MYDEMIAKRNYQHIMDNILFLNNYNEILYKPLLESLFLEVWDRIPVNDRQIVHMNLEFIICKQIEAQFPSSPGGGVTQLSETGRCWVIYNPIGWNKDTQLYILAHELAHVFYEHPKKQPNNCDQSIRNNYILNVAEPEAHKKANEWGFKPDPIDFDKIKGYKDFLASENR